MSKSRVLLALLATGACYYLATRIAWLLFFPDSKVALFFPPHAVLVAVLLLVPTRHWWAYVLAASCGHFVAAQQVQWPPLYALACEIFDATKALLTAGGVRLLVKSRFDHVSLRDAILFVAIAVVVVPAATSLGGAIFIVASHPGSDYWGEWRNLGISNAVTTQVLLPAILAGFHQWARKDWKVPPARMLEASALAGGMVVVAFVAFHQPYAGPDTSPTLLYAPVPFLVWAALRFGIGGTSASMLLVTSMAISGAMRGNGPFLARSASQNVMDLQLFLLVLGVPLMLLAAAINDERRSKEALRVSEERMGLSVDSAQLALWDWDVANDAVWMSDHGRRFFRFAPDEPLHFSSLGGRVHPDDRAMRTAAIRHALETFGAYEMEYRVVLPGGTVRWVAARGRYAGVAAPGAPARIVGISMDITRQKEAGAQAQQQREELAHLSRVATLGALSGSLAHELTQPLTSILSNAQAGRRFMARDKPDLRELPDVLADIEVSAARAGGIIERLRIMLRRSQVALQPVSVSSSIEELLRLTGSDLVARGVSVSNLVGTDLAPVMTDRVQFQQVLLNLILNACDAMESKPPAERIVTLTASEHRDEMRISVLDLGIGLPEDVESLFQPFQTTKEGGLGIGLSICQTLVISQGGRLWAEPRAGGGAAFHVALPLAAQGG